MKKINSTVVWLTVFSIAMGFLETAVVVYIRKLYYPAGFQFPLLPISRDIATTEFFRELATIIMLIGAGVMAGKNSVQRFAFFLYCFAIWDIFYYVFLKVILSWPESLFTWDILFLIPVPWVGPVIAPCLISLSFILFTWVVIHFQNKGQFVFITLFEKTLLLLGSLIAILAFMWDYLQYIHNYPSRAGVWTLPSNSNMFDEVKNYVPTQFNWPLFAFGQCLILLAIFFIYKRLNIQKNQLTLN